MDYSKIYYTLIEYRKQNPYDGYTECHHIIPKSLGGSDDDSNLVQLSAREHFVCHLLLTKMYEKDTPKYHKMIKAFMMMLVCRSNNQERYLTSKTYESVRIAFSKTQSRCQSGSGNSQYGKPRSEETKNKIRDSMLKKKESLRKEKEADKLAKQQFRKQKHSDAVETYRKYYAIYSSVGWDKFVETTRYPYSKQNLVRRFEALLPEFVPQNGKRRGK